MMRIVALGDGDADGDAEGDGDPLVAPPIRGDTPISALTITIVARLPAIAASTRSTYLGPRRGGGMTRVVSDISRDRAIDVPLDDRPRAR